MKLVIVLRGGNGGELDRLSLDIDLEQDESAVAQEVGNAVISVVEKWMLYSGDTIRIEAVGD